MNQSALQGIYLWRTRIIYLAFCPGNDTWYYKVLHIGTSAGTYSTMRKLSLTIQRFLLHATPLVITHLMPDTVVSDLYPELFI